MSPVGETMLMKNEEDLVEIDLEESQEQKWVYGPIYQKDTGMQMLCGAIFK
jgi:hypothetical protein